jgi:tetratricopeptide (TPR) repeat protein
MKDLEKFEEYINGELEEGDLWEFKKSLKEDVELEKQFELYQTIRQVSTNSKKQLFMEELNSIHKAQQPKGNKLFHSFKRSWAIAASLVILVAAGFGILNFRTQNSNQKLFETYFQTESAAFAVRSASNNMEEPVLDGMQLYELHNYDAAIEMFEKSPNNLMGKLYAGLSLMELGEYDEAITKFQYIVDHNDNLFIDQAAWYQSLCYLKTGNREVAAKGFKSIAADNGVYKTKSQKILNEMEIE